MIDGENVENADQGGEEKEMGHWSLATWLADNAGNVPKKEEMNQTRKNNRLSTYRFALPGAKFGQRTCTLLLPLLFGHPHVVLVGDLLS